MRMKTILTVLFQSKAPHLFAGNNSSQLQPSLLSFTLVSIIGNPLTATLTNTNNCKISPSGCRQNRHQGRYCISFIND